MARSKHKEGPTDEQLAHAENIVNAEMDAVRIRLVDMKTAQRVGMIDRHTYEQTLTWIYTRLALISEQLDGILY